MKLFDNYSSAALFTIQTEKGWLMCDAPEDGRSDFKGMSISGTL